jgi:hypothetical protein
MRARRPGGERKTTIFGGPTPTGAGRAGRAAGNGHPPAPALLVLLATVTVALTVGVAILAVRSLRPAPRAGGGTGGAGLALPGRGPATHTGGDRAIAVVTTPPGARLAIDGHPVAGAQTPATIALDAGEHLLAVDAPGFQSLTFPVAIPAVGATPRLDLALTPDRPSVVPWPVPVPGFLPSDLVPLDDGRLLTIGRPVGSPDDYEVWQTDVVGRPRRLGPGRLPGRVAVSPDGRTLAYLARDADEPPATSRFRALLLAPSQIDAPADTPAPVGVRRLAFPVPPRGQAGLGDQEWLVDARFTPDGAALVVLTQRAAGGKLSTARALRLPLDRADAPPRELAAFSGGVQPGSLVCAPSGRTCAAIAAQGAATATVALVGTDPDRPFLRTVPLVATTDARPPLAWSPDERQIAYPTLADPNDGSGEIVLGLLDLERPDPARPLPGAARTIAPAWLAEGPPDGRLLGLALGRSFDDGVRLRAVGTGGREATTSQTLDLPSSRPIAATWDLAHRRLILGYPGPTNSHTFFVVRLDPVPGAGSPTPRATPGGTR